MHTVRAILYLWASISVGFSTWLPSYSYAEDSPSCVLAKMSRGLLGVTPEELPAFAANSGSFLLIPPVTPERASELNAQFLRNLRDEPFPAPSEKRKAALTPDEITALHEEIKANPQVQETSATGRYQGSDLLGFCFGRALIAHFLAIDFGLNKASIRKIWAVGNFTSNDVYHVTTMVRMKSGDWWALDPNYLNPMPVRQWMNDMKSQDASGTMRFYSAPGNRLWVTDDLKALGLSAKPELDEPGYKGFFTDFIRRFRENLKKSRAQAAQR